MSKIVLARIQLARPTTEMFGDMVQTLKLLGWSVTAWRDGAVARKGSKQIEFRVSGGHLELLVPHNTPRQLAEEVKGEWDRALLLAYFVGALKAMGMRPVVRGSGVLGVGGGRVIKVMVEGDKVAIDFLFYPGSECDAAEGKLSLKLAERGLYLSKVMEYRKARRVEARRVDAE